jgi:ribosome biogenesis protein BRX1
MAESKLTGNCLKGSRPILSFDSSFDNLASHKLLKELFMQVFGTPKGYPKAKPFIDHTFSFYNTDGRIFFRNYQIVYDAHETGSSDPVLVEVGPRFILVPIRIFS